MSPYVSLHLPISRSPGDFDLSPTSADNQLIARAIDDPSSLNPIFFFIFNALGLIPAVNPAFTRTRTRTRTRTL